MRSERLKWPHFHALPALGLVPNYKPQSDSDNYKVYGLMFALLFILLNKAN
jgi:hypothetical protein